MMEEITLTGPQICVAGQAAGYSHLILPDDPFRGWLVEEITEEIQRARLELVQAGVFNLENGQLSPELQIIIEALGTPERSIALNYTAAGNGVDTLILHRSEGNWLRLDQLASGEYKISFIELERVVEHLTDFLHIGGQPAHPGKTISLSEVTLREARQAGLEQNAEACLQVLAQAGVSRGKTQNLFHALTAPVASGAAVFVTWEERQVKEQAGVAFLEDSHGLYQMTENQEIQGWINMEPVSAIQLSKNIAAAIQGLV